MLRHTFLLVLMAVGPVLFLTGAWPGPTPPPAASLFLARPVPLTSKLIGAEVTGPELLDLAIAQLALPRVTWLRTQLWQKMNDARSEFELEGTLDLGPGLLVRLDLEVRTVSGSGRCLTISDGHAFVHVRRLSGCLPEVTSQLLPLGNGATAERMEYLENQGCGGPHALLTALRRQLRDIRLETGVLNATAVIRLGGQLDHAAGAEDILTSHAFLYLDADTLWPQRVEWWSARVGDEPLVALEFRRPALNRALSEEECARLFSYPEPISSQ
jgi:hypothetical protein